MRHSDNARSAAFIPFRGPSSLPRVPGLGARSRNGRIEPGYTEWSPVTSGDPPPHEFRLR